MTYILYDKTLYTVYYNVIIYLFFIYTYLLLIYHLSDTQYPI